MCEERIRSYAQDKRFGSATVARWLRQPAGDRRALLEFAVRLRLGQNQFRLFLDMLEGIAARRGCTVSDVLALEPVVSVLSRRLGRNETIGMLKRVLHRLRYPQLAEVEGRLAELIKALPLPVGTSVKFPDNLEGESVTVILNAVSARDLRVRAAELVSALQRPEVEEIFRLLGGEW